MTRTLIVACLALAAITSAMAEDKHAHGQDIPLGTKTMGAWKVTANRIGDWIPGKSGAGTVDLVPAQPAAKAVRVWIGDEEGRGATKAKGEPEATHPGGWHLHLAVPEPIPTGARFWVTIDTDDGQRIKESFPLEATPAK